MEGYSEKTDIYSLGVTLCELGNGEIPYCKYEPQLILVEKVYGRQPFLYDMHTCRFLFENGKGLYVSIINSSISSNINKNRIKCREKK